MGLQVQLTPSIGAPQGVCKKVFGVVNGTRIDVWYFPEPKDQSTEIVFLQVMREWLDGVSVLPSKLLPAFGYQDPDTTARFFHLDYFQGEHNPYGNSDDPQDAATDVGKPGKAIPSLSFHGINLLPNPVAALLGSAWFWDQPSFGAFPVGGSKMKWEFRTAAFSAAGADAGTYYQYQDWTYEMEKGKNATVTLGLTGFDPGPDFKDAVNLWCKNHAFNLPKPAPPAPAVPAAPGAKRYVVTNGDYLSKIAQMFYGNGNLWPKIYDANKAVIGPNPNLILPGQTLVIP